MIRIETVDIIKDLVAGLNLKLKIDSVTDQTGDKYLLTTCDTHYLQKGNTLTLGLVSYKVLAVVSGESIQVSGKVIPVVGSYVLPAPYFFHGSILQTNTELTPIKDLSKKTPMVYLKRPYRDRFFESRDAANDRETSLTLFFLTQANFAEWRTEDHDKHAVKPMRSLAYSFVNMLKKNYQVATIDSVDYEDRIKFGVTLDKGVEKSYWNDNLSGVQVDLTITVKKNYECKC